MLFFVSVYGFKTLCLECLSEVVDEVVLVLDTASHTVESAVEFLWVEVHSLVVLTEEYYQAACVAEGYS